MRRNKRMMYEVCMQDETKTFLHPIIDWTSDEVWQYIRENKVPYCSLYDEWFKRIGCVMCPMGGAKQIKRDMKRFPKIADGWKRAIGRAYQNRIDRGDVLSWQSGNEMFEFWISGEGKKDSENTLFEE